MIDNLVNNAVQCKGNHNDMIRTRLQEIIKGATYSYTDTDIGDREIEFMDGELVKSPEEMAAEIKCYLHRYMSGADVPQHVSLHMNCCQCKTSEWLRQCRAKAGTGQPLCQPPPEFQPQKQTCPL